MYRMEAQFYFKLKNKKVIVTLCLVIVTLFLIILT